MKEPLGAIISAMVLDTMKFCSLVCFGFVVLGACGVLHFEHFSMIVAMMMSHPMQSHSHAPVLTQIMPNHVVIDLIASGILSIAREERPEDSFSLPGLDQVKGIGSASFLVTSVESKLCMAAMGLENPPAFGTINQLHSTLTSSCCFLLRTQG